MLAGVASAELVAVVKAKRSEVAPVVPGAGVDSMPSGVEVATDEASMSETDDEIDEAEPLGMMIEVDITTRSLPLRVGVSVVAATSRFVAPPEAGSVSKLAKLYPQTSYSRRQRLENDTIHVLTIRLPLRANPSDIIGSACDDGITSTMATRQRRRRQACMMI